MVSSDMKEPQGHMTCPINNAGQESCKSRIKQQVSKQSRWCNLYNISSLLFTLKLFLSMNIGQCYDGIAGISLLEEAGATNNEAHNAKDGFAIGCCWLRRTSADHAGMASES
jgi:hypothetical protein